MSTNYVNRFGAQCATWDAWWVIHDGLRSPGPAQFDAIKAQRVREEGPAGPAGPQGPSAGECAPDHSQYPSYAELLAENGALQSMMDARVVTNFSIINRHAGSFAELEKLRKENQRYAAEIERLPELVAAGVRAHVNRELLHWQVIATVAAIIALALLALLVLPG